MNQYAALSQLQANQNQNALAQYQLAAAQRADEATNVQNQLYAKHYDAKTGKVNQSGLLADLAQNPNAAGLIPKLQAQFSDQQHKENVNAKTVAETSKITYEQEIKKNDKAIAHIASLSNPQEALASINSYVKKGEIEQDKANVIIQSLKNTPNFNAWKKTTLMSILDAKDRLHQEYQDKMATIAGGNLAVNQGQLNLARDKFAFETNPEKVATIAEAKKTAELTATDKLAKAKTIEGANQILKDIKYDAKTKDNDVSKLIDISTGSYGGAAINLGNRVFGRSTEGSKAIAELKTIESKITTDLLGGKLGSGISNADRDFIQQQVGLIGDATLPTGDRKAAWDRVVSRLANISSETSSSSTLPTPSAATVKPSLNEIFNPAPKK
jgi:hypothetical protein